MKNRTLVLICALCSLFVLLLSSCTDGTASHDSKNNLFDENGTANLETIEYSRDIEPLNRTFKGLKENIVDGFWKYYEWGVTDLGPSTYIVSGFIMVSPNESDKICNQYAFESADVQFPKGISPEDTGYSDFNWGYNADFTKMILGGRWVGDAFFDTNNKIIYVYVGNK